MSDLCRAKELLASDPSLTCVFVRGEETVLSRERGIAPLLRRVRENMPLCGYCAADRIVGKAAALLYALLGVKEVYAAVLGERAIPVLETHGIGYTFGVKTERIVNRAGTGSCPMELAVEKISDPAAGAEALAQRAEELKNSAKK